MAQRIFRRFKIYRWTSTPIAPATGLEIPDAKLLVDADADFLLTGWNAWSSGAGPTWLYRIADAEMRYLANVDLDGGNDFPIAMVGTAPEQGFGNLVKVISPARRIPAGAAITIRVTEFTGTTPQFTWVKFAFYGWKEYRV